MFDITLTAFRDVPYDTYLVARRVRENTSSSAAAEALHANSRARVTKIIAFIADALKWFKGLFLGFGDNS